MSRFWEDSRRIAVRPLFLLPCRLKIRHRLLTARSITAIMRALRDARGDRPEALRQFGQTAIADPATLPRS